MPESSKEVICLPNGIKIDVNVVNVDKIKPNSGRR